MNTDIPGFAGAELAERRRRLLGDAYSLFYDRPVHLVRGEGVWLTDADGRRYLDAYNNVPHVGHCHPRVVEAICRQAGTLNTHTRYLHETVLDVAETLTARFPDGLGTVMFTCTGTEANELALRIARAASGGNGFIVTDNAYHGNSWAIAQISPGELPAAEREDNVVTVPAPDPYRGRHRGADAAERYADCVREAVDTLRERGHRPAALVLDTILSSDGLPDIPSGYLERATRIVREAGGLFLADEVQAGFGRTGSHFWGFERLGAVPDLVTLGKPMGNGHPVAAVIASREVLGAFEKGPGYFNTFGGNPVSCAAALAVLQVIEEEALQANALDVGAHLREGLLSLAGRHEAIGDVRGAGLYVAVDLVRDRESREPATGTARAVHNGMRDRGVLIGIMGPHGNVLKIRPPMVFSRDSADLLIETLDAVLGEVGGQ